MSDTITKKVASKNNNYAFIGSQNLNLGVQSSGWKLDYKKFRLDLLRDKLEYTRSKNKPALAVGQNLRPAWNGDTL